MKPGASAAFLRDTQALFAAGSVAGLEDEQLLARFSAGLGVVSELAFAGLVSRHGPMVLATCRRTLGDLHQADDAFQATFLVLARRARTVRGRSLGPWLYGVARKVCRKARGDRDRRAHREARSVPRTTAAIDPTDLAHQAELRDLIDRELARIPARLREAIVLCDLQGLSHDEAARRLGCPAGTIKSRQARGRARLRERLEKLGLDPAAVASPSAIVSARLASATASAALNFQIGGLIEAGVGPASIALSLSTLRELSMIHLFKITAATAAGLGTVAVAASGLVQDPAPTPALPSTPAPAEARTLPAPSTAPQPIPAALPTVNAQDQPKPAAAPQPAIPSFPPTAARPTSAQVPSMMPDSPGPVAGTGPNPFAPPSPPFGPYLVDGQGKQVDPNRLPLPPVDRLQSLEQKLDRVLSALERSVRGVDASPSSGPRPERDPNVRERSTRNDAPRNDRPLIQQLSDYRRGIGPPPNLPAGTVLVEPLPGQPVPDPNPAPSLEARIAALESRVKELENTTTQKLSGLQSYVSDLYMRVTGAPLAQPVPNPPVSSGPNAKQPWWMDEGRKAADHADAPPVADDLPLPPKSNTDGTPPVRRGSRR